MLFLRYISLLQFKNYSSRSFEIKERIVGICGKNGVGKTNLLDAVYYLCFTKSYFSWLDNNNVQQGKSGFRIEGSFNWCGQEEKAVCILREEGKKEFSLNEKQYDKFSRHIGHYPCVVIAPDDSVLITGNSEERRKFTDALLSQIDPSYLQHLIAYTRLLQQRNALLKSFAESNRRDLSLLDVLDQQLAKPGTYLFEKRKKFLQTFLPLVKKMYASIAQQEEDIVLNYESQLLQAPFEELLNAARQKDCMAMRTTAGIHRDDISISFGSQPFKNSASQGQRKSLLFALKLSEMEVLKEEKGFPPLLLLDDIFEKLDEDRISNLLQKVCIENKGQVFITDTNEERLKKHLEELDVQYQLITL
jgi:DNA replication and repair protein RecF